MHCASQTQNYENVPHENEHQRIENDFNVVKEKINLNQGYREKKLSQKKNIQHIIIKLCGSFRWIRCVYVFFVHILYNFNAFVVVVASDRSNVD